MQGISIDQLRSFVLLGLVLYAGVVDLREYRISNRSVLITALLGWIWNVSQHQMGGFTHSVLGLLVGLGLLLPFYVLGGMTAGDVKWLGALGVWYGPKGVLGLFMISGLILGVISVFWIAFSYKRSTRDNQRLPTQEKELDTIFESEDRRRFLIPYALPTALGVLLVEILKVVWAR